VEVSSSRGFADMGYEMVGWDRECQTLPFAEICFETWNLSRYGTGHLSMNPEITWETYRTYWDWKSMIRFKLHSSESS
jgi:hypothetical protein